MFPFKFLNSTLHTDTCSCCFFLVSIMSRQDMWQPFWRVQRIIVHIPLKIPWCTLWKRTASIREKVQDKIYVYMHVLCVYLKKSMITLWRNPWLQFVSPVLLEPSAVNMGRYIMGYYITNVDVFIFCLAFVHVVICSFLLHRDEYESKREMTFCVTA